MSPEKTPDGFVITGQQIGLLGGPLYTTYKVLGAAKLAEESGFQAVYWLETNDADFEEINHLDFINSSGETKRLVWEKKTGGTTSGSILIDDTLVDLLENFFSSLPQTDATADLRAMTLGIYQNGRAFGDASEALARELFGFLPLVFFRPDQKEFRDFSKPYLLREAARTEEGSQANAFILDTRNGKSLRRAIFKKNGAFQTREGESVDPEKFTLLPNVKTRNVCQDAYFASLISGNGKKPLAYVAGPGEIAYLKEMSGSYAFHQVEPAEVVPRMSATLLEPKTKRLLEKSGLGLNQILNGDSESLRKKIMALATGEDLEASKVKAESAFRGFVKEIGGLGFDAGRIEKDVYETLKHVVGKKRLELKQKSDLDLKRLEELLKPLKPRGEKQERIFNLFQFMNLRGGKDFVKELYRRYAWGETVLEI